MRSSSSCATISISPVERSGLTVPSGGVEDDLRAPVTVAEVEKDEPAVIPVGVDPTRENDGRVDVRSPQFATVVRALKHNDSCRYQSLRLRSKRTVPNGSAPKMHVSWCCPVYHRGGLRTKQGLDSNKERSGGGRRKKPGGKGLTGAGGGCSILGFALLRRRGRSSVYAKQKRFDLPRSYDVGELGQ